MENNVTVVELDNTLDVFKNKYVGCVILTKDDKILLQQRPDNFSTYPGYLCEFGGKIEQGEEPQDALVREIKEELGAKLNLSDTISCGAITELMSEHSELIYTYFWHDSLGSITGCYEGQPRYFARVEDIMSFPKITDGLRWLLLQCQNKGLIE